MPNWIINRLIIKGNPERIRELLEAIKSEYQPLDFDRIIPSPEAIHHIGLVFSPDTPEPRSVYWIDGSHSRPLTADEQRELENVGYRCSRDWCAANWGTDRIAFEVEIDASTADLGYVVIKFETAWSPPVRILERLQEEFSELAFCCEWFAEDECFYRYQPSQSTAIARSEQNRPGEHVVATLYLTRAEYPEFFLQTQVMKETTSEYPREESTIESMSWEEARSWMLASDVELLALLYPELPKAEANAFSREVSPAKIADESVAAPD